MMNSGFSSDMTEDFKASYEEIQEQIQNDLQDELIKFKDGQSIDWNFIRRNLEKLPTPLLSGHENQIWDFFRFLIHIFDTYKIRDSYLVEDVLQYASYAAIAYSTPNFPPEEELKLWFKQRDIYRNENRLTFEKVDVMQMFSMNMGEKDLRTNCSIHLLRKIPYAWDSHLGRNMVKYTDRYLHIVWELATRGNDYLLSIFLKHGVLYLKTSKYHESEIHHDFTLNMLSKTRTLPHHEHSIFISERFQFSVRILEVLKAMEIIAEFMFFRKFYSQAPPDSAISCFKKIYDSIPEPFVKVQEVRKALEKIARRDPEKFDYSMVEPMCEEFEKNFPESTGPRTPRSLKHLIRCQIRENLRKVLGLPYKVSLLPIPIRLQKYINLEM